MTIPSFVPGRATRYGRITVEEPTLTIAIPTFNRATLLDKQISWLTRAVEGHESHCTIHISDNHSTDDTPYVLEK